MILTGESIDPVEFERRTGWAIKPQGACKGEMCVPLFVSSPTVEVLSDRLGMPIVRDDTHGLTALGPDTAGGRALTSAEAPDIVLPDRQGNEFALRSLKGQKVFLLAWASW